MEKLISFLIILAVTYSGYSQNNPGDCVGAIPVCKNIYDSPTPYLYKGEGLNGREIAGLPGTDCRTQELDGVWYLFTIQESGALRFSIRPNNNFDDYDWIVFDLTNRRCEDIYYHTNEYMLSSNNFGDEFGVIVETGANSLKSNGSAGNCNGPGTELGPPFNDDIPVTKGGTYVLYLSNWSQSQSGFVIDFSASTAKLFDNVQPELTQINASVKCNDKKIEVQFSEQILCAGVNTDFFKITSPSGKIIPVSFVQSSCTQSSSADKSNYFILHLFDPISEPGQYTIEVIGDSKDACNNTVRNDKRLNFNVEFAAQIWGKSTMCKDEKITLNTTDIYDSYKWNTGETTRTIIVNKPGTYEVTVSSGVCSSVDKHQIAIINTEFSLGKDTSFCSNEKITLGPDVVADRYLWNTGEKTKEITTNKPGRYILEIEKLACKNKDTIEVSTKVIPYPKLGKDRELCTGDSVLLELDQDYESYIWNTGVSSKTITTKKGGVYSVRVNKNNCSNSDSVTVSEINLNFDLGDDTTVICSNIYKVLDPKISNASYSWNTGAKTQTISVNKEGIYILNISKSFCKSTDTITIKLKIAPEVNLGKDSTICFNDSVVYDAGADYEEFLWNTGSTEQKITIYEPGQYILTVQKNTCSDKDTVFVFQPDLNFDFGDNINKCEYDIIELNPNVKAEHYLWNTNEITSSIFPKTSGNYKLTIKTAHCTAEDSVFVELAPYPFIGIDTFYQACLGATIKLDPQTDADFYFWNEDDYSYTKEFTQNDTIMISAVLGNCKSSKNIEIYFEECPAKFILPNVFTPNGDGKNDFFTVKGEDIFEYHIEIYNRWGQIVFNSYDMNSPWDGSANGKKVSPDTYYYIIFHKFGSLTGYLNLFR